MIARGQAPDPAPNPTRMLFVLSEDAIESPDRRVDCLHEIECLTYADRQRWPGFSCRRCLAFTIAPWTLRREP